MRNLEKITTKQKKQKGNYISFFALCFQVVDQPSLAMYFLYDDNIKYGEPAF